LFWIKGKDDKVYEICVRDVVVGISDKNNN